MRKIVLLFFGAITFIACSEEAVSVSENQNVVRREGVNIESLYLSMISSESYIMAEEALSHFITKMNFDGNVSDIDTEARMFSWISANLSMTTFSDLSEAEAHWQEVQNLKYVSVEDNIGFYEAIDGRERDLEDLIIEFDPVITVIPNNNPICDTTFNECINTATTIYVSDVTRLLVSFSFSEIGVSINLVLHLTLARSYFINNVINCTDSYNLCILNQ